jgi:major membrane immunogen (membrane-anchored lipoprotein)
MEEVMEEVSKSKASMLYELALKYHESKGQEEAFENYAEKLLGKKEIIRVKLKTGYPLDVSEHAFLNSLLSN